MSSTEVDMSNTLQDVLNNPIERYPPGASEEYKSARLELLKEEWVLRDQLERVAALRRSLPPGAEMKPYTFHEKPNVPVTLADLTSDGRSLVVWHIMFAPKDDAPCPMCACFVDGLNAAAPHLNQRVNVGIIGKAPIEKLKAYADKRGWDNLRVLSSFGSDFNSDMRLENPPWAASVDQMPGLSVFKKGDDGVVRHVYTLSAQFDNSTSRGADLLTPVWNILDLVPEGRGDIPISNDYIKMKA